MLIAYLFPLATGLLVSPTGTFHLLGSKAEHAATAWRLFGALLWALAIVVVRLIREHCVLRYTPRLPRCDPHAPCFETSGQSLVANYPSFETGFLL